MFNKNYAQYYDLFNKNKPYKKEIQFVHEWAKKPKSIFDIGCGRASYWQFYPKYVQLLGIDSSRAMAHGNKDVVIADIQNYRTKKRFEAVTALFDVLNYIEHHGWWKNIPIELGGYFIFDIWDKEKVDRNGFRKTQRAIGDLIRTVYPFRLKNRVELRIEIEEKLIDSTSGIELLNHLCTEYHRMILHSHEDIHSYAKAGGFKIVDVKPTKKWQIWYKLRKI